MYDKWELGIRESLEKLGKDFDVAIEIIGPRKTHPTYYGKHLVFKHYVAFSFQTIGDYLQKSNEIFYEAKKGEGIRRPSGVFKFLSNEEYISIFPRCKLNNLIVKEEIKDSYYEDVTHKGSGGVFFSSRTVRIPRRRMDFVLSDSSSTLLGYLTYDTTDNESWAHALYSQKDDVITVNISSLLNKEAIPFCKIYGIKNHSLANRLKCLL